jgi:ABC-type multidrug transport system fused ATPase/permease subunit
MLTMARSILVTEIFAKATRARIGASDDSAAVTLMSTDIERANLGFRSLHDIWASVIQVALAAWMLYNQLGIVFVAPMGVVIICFAGLVILMKFTGDSQRAWMAGVQKRVGLTATVITNMKNLKISGLTTTVGNFVQKLRVDELAAGSRCRKIALLSALLAFIPIMASPPLAFAFAQRTLHVSRMFTSLSYLFLLTNPLDLIFISTPQLLSGLACLGRIQAFLECETRHDFRQVLTDLRQTPEKARADAISPHSPGSGFSHPVVITDGNLGWEADKFALRDVNTRLSKSSLTMVVGPVGSGKSTLCKTLLGEIPFSQGSVVLSTRLPHVGFCDQTAFLSNASIRDNIVGFSPFDDERYSEAIEATALRFDLERLPQGDRTNVGSDGITLSGGQKQRICLARALYLQSELLVLDDIFSGLDADTEEQVFRQVFGPDGLLRRRRSTVVLATHSVRHLPVADHIIALEDGMVVEQGSFHQLMTLQGYVQRMGLRSPSDSDTSFEQTTSEKRAKGLKPQLLQATTTNTSSSAPATGKLRQVSDKSVYRYYFKSMGIFLAVWSFFFAALWGFFSNFPTICECIFVFQTNDGEPDQFGHSINTV